MIPDVLIEARQWHDLPLRDVARRAALETLRHLGVSHGTAALSLLACDDARIKALNAGFRDKDAATNVLSWPAQDLAPPTPGARPKEPVPDIDGTLELGDVAIAYETCASEAAALAKSLEDHVTHLIVHGILHLFGYDHIRDRDATLMQALETEILGKLGLDDPYRN